MVDYHRFCDTVLNPEDIKLVLESWKAITIREAQVKKQSAHQQENMMKGDRGGERGGGERGGGGYGRGDTGGGMSRTAPSGGSSSANGQKQISKHHNSGSYY